MLLASFIKIGGNCGIRRIDQLANVWVCENRKSSVTMLCKVLNLQAFC